MHARAGRITQITAKLMLEHGNTHSLLSPIVHGHALIQTGIGKSLPHKWGYWEKHDLNLLKRCDELWVVCMPGWDKSSGVDAEIGFARRNKIKIRYITTEGEQV